MWCTFGHIPHLRTLFIPEHATSNLSIQRIGLTRMQYPLDGLKSFFLHFSVRCCVVSNRIPEAKCHRTVDYQLLNGNGNTCDLYDSHGLSVCPLIHLYDLIRTLVGVVDIVLPLIQGFLRLINIRSIRISPIS